MKQVTLISVCLWWLWYIGTGVDCYLVYCWWIWYLSTNIPLISAYCWWLWHQYTADDSDICPLVMTLTSGTCLSTERSNLPSHFISHSQIYLIHMFTFNYRKCTLSWEFNLIKRALNWELAWPGKSGSQISPWVFYIRLILKNPEVICLWYALVEISKFSPCILVKICH